MKKNNLKEWFWPIFWENRSVYFHVLLAAFFINVFALALPLFIMNVYDRVLPNYATETLWVLSLGLIIVLIFDFILKNMRAYFIDINARRLDLKLGKHIFNKVLHARLSKLPQTSGELVNDVIGFQNFRDFITSATVTILIDLPFALLFILTLGFIAGSLFLIPLISAIIIFLAVLFLQPHFQRYSDDCNKAIAKKQAVVIESVNGAETLRAMNAHRWPYKIWDKAVHLLGINTIKLNRISNGILSFSGFMQQLTIVLFVIFSVYSIASGKISSGVLIAGIILTTRALAPLVQLADLLTRYNRALTSIQAVDKLMEVPNESSVTEKNAEEQKIEGDLEFRDVSFSYPEYQENAIDNLSFHLKPGEHIALLGRIGSGKTTIMRLIMQIYLQEKGNIYINDSDSRQYALSFLRKNIAYVPQDIVLFNDTLKNNIVFDNPNISDKEIMRACELAGIDQLISQHPLGLLQPVGERGRLLSGGQKQSVAIARALIKNAPIILFDEPTNSMDEASEKNLIHQLQPYLKNRTFILITHKLSMLTLVDRIMILEKGKKIADGSKEQILAKLSEAQKKAAE